MWRQFADCIMRYTPRLLFGAVLCSLVVGTGFREDEVQCEETVAYLEDCCPGFDSRAVNCTWGGCGPSPYLTAEESRCIRELSCAEISERGLCEYRGQDAGADDSGPVCQ
jgi:hypothetical protein